MDSLTKQQEKILAFIIKELDINNETVQLELSNFIYKNTLNNYSKIKSLSKNITEFLKKNGFQIKHSQILNILAKILGYQNHHSLKKLLDTPQNNSIEIDVKNDSTLKKLFLIRKEFINQFGINRWYISQGIKTSHEFSFIYDKYGVSTQSKQGREINSYFKSYGIKPYKNTISLFKIKSNNIQKVAFNIILKYKSFFTPTWYEGNDTYYSIRARWAMLSYSSITYNEDLLLVNSYSTDMYWNIVNNYLDYILTFGIIDDIDFLEKSLVDKEYRNKKNSLEEFKTFADISRVYSWEDVQLKKQIIGAKQKSIKETLENISYIINIRDYMYPFMKEFESNLNKPIKAIIIDSCEYFYNFQKIYILDDIQNRLSIELFKKSKNQYFDEMKELEEDYQEYHFRYNCMRHLSFEVEKLLKVYIEVNCTMQKEK